MIKLSLVVFFLTHVAYAYDGFRCIPSLRQTRVQVLKKEKQIELLVVNPSGYEFMPQFDSSGSAYSISFNKMQAEDLKALGDVFRFTWPAEKCKMDSLNLSINCEGEAISDVENVKSYGVTTTEITEKYQADIYEKRRFRLSAESGNTYFVNLEFYKQNCEKFNQGGL